MNAKSGSNPPSLAGRLRRPALFLLLFAEAGVTGALFDAEPIHSRADGWWVRLLAQGGAATPIAIAIATAVLLFGERAWREGLAASTPGAAPRRAAAILLALQVALFGLMLWTGSTLFGERLREVRAPGLWATAWVLLGAGATLAWAALLVPPRALLALLRGCAGLLATCAAIGALAWLAGRATERWWMPLRDTTVGLVEVLLAGSGLEVAEDEAGVTLALGDFAVAVGKACSGYEGIGLMTVFVGVFLAWFRDRLRFPRALLLLPVGVVAAWLGNGLRLAALLEIGARISPEIAMGGFHSYSGSLLFSALALGLAAVARRSPFFARVGEELPDISPGSDPAAFLMPWLALLLVAMLTGAASPGGVDPLYPVRIAAAIAVLIGRRAAYRGLAVAPAWQAVALGALGFAAWLALAAADPRPGGSSWDAVRGAQGTGWFLARLAGALVVVPLVEELAFRGYLARRIVDRDFAAVAPDRIGALPLLLSAVAFGLLHDRFLAATLAGALYGLALRRRGQVADAFAAHATTNLLLLAWVAATGRWDLWG